MKCDHLRDYVRVRDLVSRWKLDRDSTDLHWAIMKGVLRPCIWVRGELPEMAIDADGGALALPTTHAINAWCYPCRETQIGAYEVAYSTVRDESGEQPRYLGLFEPILLSEVVRDGVVMMGELVAAEATLKVQQDDELHGKERITLYKLIVAAVSELYSCDPLAERSNAVAELVRVAEAIGQPVSYNAAREHVRRAWARCGPQLE